jgi:RNA polymerase sigma-70 factor (ECF subfamily)
MAEDTPLVELAQLVADHHAVLYRYAFRLTGSVADAEDLTQQTFLIAQTRLEQVRSAESVRGWLFTVMRNAFLKQCRKRQPAAATRLDFSLEEIADDIPEPAAVEPEELQAALDALPLEFKVVVLMFYFEHRSYREIAEELDIALGTVMSRLSRAKVFLRQELFADEPQRSTDHSRRLARSGRGS